ncbi:unnamed protein product [Closterium sp. NIES-54]
MQEYCTVLYFHCRQSKTKLSSARPLQLEVPQETPQPQVKSQVLFSDAGSFQRHHFPSASVIPPLLPSLLHSPLLAPKQAPAIPPVPSALPHSLPHSLPLPPSLPPPPPAHPASWKLLQPASPPHSPLQLSSTTPHSHPLLPHPHPPTPPRPPPPPPPPHPLPPPPLPAPREYPNRNQARLGPRKGGAASKASAALRSLHSWPTSPPDHQQQEHQEKQQEERRQRWRQQRWW